MEGNSVFRKRCRSTPSLLIAATLKMSKYCRKNIRKPRLEGNFLPHTSSTRTVSVNCQGDAGLGQFDAFFLAHVLFVVSIHVAIQKGASGATNTNILSDQRTANWNLRREEQKIVHHSKL